MIISEDRYSGVAGEREREIRKNLLQKVGFDLSFKESQKILEAEGRKW